MYITNNIITIVIPIHIIVTAIVTTTVTATIISHLDSFVAIPRQCFHHLIYAVPINKPSPLHLSVSNLSSTLKVAEQCSNRPNIDEFAIS